MLIAHRTMTMTMTMTKNMSIVLIAVIAAVMITGTLEITTTSSVFAYLNTNNGGNAGNGVNGGTSHPGHNACDNAGPAEHNPHCQ